MKIVINDNKYSVSRVEVLSFNDCSHNRKEVILIETAWKWCGFIFGETIKILIDEIERNLCILEVMNISRFTNERHKQIDQMFIAKHGYRCLDKSVWVIFY